MRPRLALFWSIGLLVLLVVAGCEETLAPTPVVRFDESYGPAPAAGWKWGLGVIAAPEAQDITEQPSSHLFAWAFYVLRGSIEIGSSTGSPTTVPAGAAAMVPPGEVHTHRFSAQSRVLLFRPSDRPFLDFHRGTKVYESDGLLPVSAGRTYRIRARELILQPGSRSSVAVDNGVAYVAEGNLVVRDAGPARVQWAGTAFGLQSNPVVLTAGDGLPTRVILVDLY